jgi:hypothetical protein
MNIEPGYEVLAAVMQKALDRCQGDKGRERHANELPFHEQPIVRHTFTEDASLFQCYKKALEVPKIKAKYGIEAAQKEVLDIMAYAAAAFLILGRQGGEVVDATEAPAPVCERPCCGGVPMEKRTAWVCPLCGNGEVEG